MADHDAPRPAPDRSSGDPAPLDRSALESAPLDALVALGELARRARAAPAPSGPTPDRPTPDGPDAAPPPAGRERPPAPEPGDGGPAPGDASPDRTNYLGDGLYRHRGREAAKLVAYVPAPVKRAVKAEAARRGLTMGELLERVLREAGYGGR